MHTAYLLTSGNYILWPSFANLKVQFVDKCERFKLPMEERCHMVMEDRSFFHEPKAYLLLAKAGEYKNLTWVWGADRQFRPEGHYLASRGFFYPHRTLVFDSFSCTSFDFECFILKVVFFTIYNDVDIGRFFKMTSLWRQPNDTVTWRPIQPMQTESTWKKIFLGWDKNFYPKRKPRISLSSMQE